jgi:ADP-ribosylglycohydrolase
VVGCVVGLALGDAAGAPFEFRRADDIVSPAPIVRLPWKGLPPGTTTDDTAMARNLVRSLVARGCLDADDLMARHLAWLASGPPDVGSLTRRVLTRVAGGVPAAEAARTVWIERGPEVSAGNGSVMYCAPLGAAYARRSDLLVDLAPELSALTHHDERCRTAVLAVTLVVAALARGEDPDAAIGAAITAVLDREGGEELEFLVGAVGETRAIDGPDRGFCLFTAGVGLQSVARVSAREASSFEGEIRRVIALGGDTDTNAAVAGALLGAALGRSSFPRAWLARLQDQSEIEAEARALVPLARLENGSSRL